MVSSQAFCSLSSRTLQSPRKQGSALCGWKEAALSSQLTTPLKKRKKCTNLAAELLANDFGCAICFRSLTSLMTVGKARLKHLSLCYHNKPTAITIPTETVSSHPSSPPSSPKPSDDNVSSSRRRSSKNSVRAQLDGNERTNGTMMRARKNANTLAYRIPNCASRQCEFVVAEN